MRLPASSVAREAVFAGTVGGIAAAALVWLGPPGADLAAHLYQRTLFIEHGFALWNNFWYAGRYSFVTYSVLYYPLAALLGIRALAVATHGVRDSSAGATAPGRSSNHLAVNSETPDHDEEIRRPRRPRGRP